MQPERNKEIHVRQWNIHWIDNKNNEDQNTMKFYWNLITGRKGNITKGRKITKLEF